MEAKDSTVDENDNAYVFVTVLLHVITLEVTLRVKEQVIKPGIICGIFAHSFKSYKGCDSDCYLAIYKQEKKNI